MCKAAAFFRIAAISLLAFFFSSARAESRDSLISAIKKAHYAEDVFQVRETILTIPVDQDYGYLHTIFVSDDGRIAISFMKSGMLWFTKNGRFIKSIGPNGRGPGEFSRPWYVTEMNKQILVGDFLQYRISIFNKKLKYARTINTTHITNSLSIVCDSLIVIDDYLNAKYNKKHDIHVYGTDGTHKKVFGEISMAAKELAMIPFRPLGPHVTSLGSFIYQTEYCDYRIRKFTCDGKLIQTFGNKPEKWKSPLHTPYKKINPNTGNISDLEPFWDEFHKCSSIPWIQACKPGLVLQCVNIPKGDGITNESIAVYDVNGVLIHPGLKLKTMPSTKKQWYDIFPLQRHGFAVYERMPENNEPEATNNNVKLRLVIFTIPDNAEAAYHEPDGIK